MDLSALTAKVRVAQLLPVLVKVAWQTTANGTIALLLDL